MLLDLPEELLVMIIGFVCDPNSKNGYFDSIHNRDIGIIRLTSQVLGRIATPFLFENMVLDEVFQVDKHIITKMLDFADQNPHLVQYVHRLQWRIAPMLMPIPTYVGADPLPEKLVQHIDSLCFDYYAEQLTKNFEGRWKCCIVSRAPISFLLGLGIDWFRYYNR